MIDLLITLFINSLVVCGFKLSVGDHMIFSFIRDFDLPGWVIAPIYGCVTCMASLWSLPFFLYFEYSWFMWPFYALALAALNTALYSIIDRLTQP